MGMRKKLENVTHINYHQYQYIYKSRDLIWKSIRFYQVAHFMQKELKYSQVKNKLNIDFLFHLVQWFKTFLIKK